MGGRESFATHSQRLVQSSNLYVILTWRFEIDIFTGGYLMADKPYNSDTNGFSFTWRLPHVFIKSGRQYEASQCVVATKPTGFSTTWTQHTVPASNNIYHFSKRCSTRYRTANLNSFKTDKETTLNVEPTKIELFKWNMPLSQKEQTTWMSSSCEPSNYRIFAARNVLYSTYAGYNGWCFSFSRT